jgi:hypothetical protein
MGSFPLAVEASLSDASCWLPIDPEHRDGTTSWRLGFITETGMGHVNFGFRKEQELDWDLRKFVLITIGFIRSCAGTHPRGAG